MSNGVASTDSYKFSHFLQYPPNTTNVFSYIEARKPLSVEDNTSVFFGLQMYLMEKLSNPINKWQVNRYKQRAIAHGEPFNEDGFNYIIDKYKGYYPVMIRAVPEGTVMGVSNVQLTVENTDPNCAWVTSFLETALLRSVWYPSTVATISRAAKKIIYQNLLETSDDPDGQIMFKLHDFGARGVSSEESASIGGCAHLVNFMGTDTFEALDYATTFYGADMAGFSIPAAEHSTMTSWGGEAGELAAMTNMLDQFAKPGKLVAVVSDSYDLFNAVSNYWGGSLKDKVINSGATVVIRPDSGDPTIIPVQVIELLGEKFGFSVNSKGYKVLPSCVRVIQGDGITLQSIPVILKNLKAAGWSGDNLAFGMGGGLLQMVHRDTLGYAMKCSAIKVDGEENYRPVCKRPITDSGKVSKAGRLQLTMEGSDYVTVRENSTWIDRNLLEPVWKNGELLRYQNFDDVRSRAKL